MLRHEEEGLQQLGAFENRSSRLSLSVFQHTRFSRTILSHVRGRPLRAQLCRNPHLARKGRALCFSNHIISRGFSSANYARLRLDVRVRVRVNERGV